MLAGEEQIPSEVLGCQVISSVKDQELHLLTMEEVPDLDTRSQAQTKELHLREFGDRADEIRDGKWKKVLR